VIDIDLSFITELALRSGSSFDDELSIDFAARRVDRYNEKADRSLVVAASNEVIYDLLDRVRQALCGEEILPAASLFVQSKSSVTASIRPNGTDRLVQRSLKRVHPKIGDKRVERLRVHIHARVTKSIGRMVAELRQQTNPNSPIPLDDPHDIELAIHHLDLIYEVMLTGSLGRIGRLLAESGSDQPTPERLEARQTWADDVIAQIHRRELAEADLLYRHAHAVHAEHASATIRKKISAAGYVEGPQHPHLLRFLDNVEKFAEAASKDLDR